MSTSMEPPGRSLDGVQYEAYREGVDAKFNTLHDDLQDAYYLYWKKGSSQPWQGYDVQATLAESKELFGKLHGLIWHEHIIALKAEHDIAVVKEEGFQENIVDKPLDKEGKPYGTSPYEKAVARKAATNAGGISITIP